MLSSCDSNRARFQRDMLTTIATKADLYRIRAEQPIGNLAIIREATVPTRPSGPSKKIELGLTFGVTLILALGYCAFAQQIRYLKANPALAGRADAILKQLHPRLSVSKD